MDELIEEHIYARNTVGRLANDEKNMSKTAWAPRKK